MIMIIMINEQLERFDLRPRPRTSRKCCVRPADQLLCCCFEFSGLNWSSSSNWTPLCNTEFNVRYNQMSYGYVITQYEKQIHSFRARFYRSHSRLRLSPASPSSSWCPNRGKLNHHLFLSLAHTYIQ